MDEQRKQFLEERRKGLGGSDVAAVLGLDKYTSPAQLYLDKTGTVETEETPAMRRGNFLEPAVIEAYCHKLQPTKVEQQVHHAVGKNGWQRGNQDARITMPDGRKINGEVKTIRKTVRRQQWGDPWTDQVPDRTLCQGYWYAQLDDAAVTHVIACVIPDDPDEVMGLSAAEVVSISEIEVFEVRRNKDNEKMIKDAASKFWWDHVVATIPPPATLGTGDHADLWPGHVPEKFIVADAETIELIELYEKVKGDAKVLTESAKQLNERLKIKLQDNEAIVNAQGTPLVTAKMQERKAHTVKESKSRPLLLTHWWKKGKR